MAEIINVPSGGTVVEIYITPEEQMRQKDILTEKEMQKTNSLDCGTVAQLEFVKQEGPARTNHFWPWVCEILCLFVDVCVFM